MATTHPPETTFGTVTSWLPATTAFPAVSGCESAIWGTNLAVAWDPRVGVSTLANLQCFPGAVTTWFRQPFRSVNTVFSLGPFECPESYITTSLSAGAVTTSFLCCPPNYDCGPGYCRSFASSGQVMTLYPQPSDSFTGLLTTTVSSLSTVQGIAINAYLFGSSSTSLISASTAASSSASATALSGPITASSTTSTEMATASASAASSSSADLTTGAKIGIGVSIPLAVIGIGALIMALLLRRRMRRQMNPGNQQAPEWAPMDHRVFQKVAVTEAHELETEAPSAELPGDPGRPGWQR